MLSLDYVTFCALDEAHDCVLLGGRDLKVIQGRIEVEQECSPVVLRDSHAFVRGLHIPAGVQQWTARAVTQKIDV